MANPSDPPIEERVEELERLVRELRLRLASLERELERRSEHPVDQSTVRTKVTYDWQS